MQATEVRGAYGVYRDLLSKGYHPQQALGLVARGVARRRRVGWQRRFTTAAGLGEDQAYYGLVTQAQNKAVAIMSEMSGIGKEAWDAALKGNPSQVQAAGWVPVENYLYDPMMSWWSGNFKKCIVTASLKPPQADLQEVLRLGTGSDKLIAFVKTLPPVAGEVAAKAEADRAETQEMLNRMGVLKSPEDVARQTFMDEIEKKAGFIFDWKTYLIPIGIAATVFVALKAAKVI